MATLARVWRLRAHLTDRDSSRTGGSNNMVDMLRAHRMSIEDGRSRIRNMTVDKTERAVHEVA